MTPLLIAESNVTSKVQK